MKIRKWLFVSALCSFIGLGFYAYKSLKVFPLLQNGESPSFFVTEQGLTVAEVLEPFEERGQLKNATALRLIIRLKGNPIALKGHYQFKPGTTVLEAIRILTNGYETPVWLRLSGYRSLEQLAEQLSDQFGFPQAESLAMLQEVGFEQILPNSYQVYHTSSLEDLKMRLLREFNAFWSPIRRQQAEKHGLTPKEVVILSSIVQAETKEASEWGRVGALYLARLKKSMRLQADPTAVYAYQLVHPEAGVIRRVLASITEFKHPYNTYQNDGLPPGPLATVEPEVIDAVLNAQPGNEIFMCADPDRPGFHVFAQSLREHNRNADRYHESLNRREIRR